MNNGQKIGIFDILKALLGIFAKILLNLKFNIIAFIISHKVVCLCSML